MHEPLDLHKISRRKISVIGLGYVGLPLAVAFNRAGFSVVGFDISHPRLAALQAGFDATREVPADILKATSIHYTAHEADLAQADFHIITVPTPIDAQNAPDLSALLAASALVGRVLKRGDVVVYESTVFPGATEEECQPILEAQSGLKAGVDFGLGYSPERINPGDTQHRFETILKVVAAQDAATLEIMAATYGAVVQAGIYRAPDLRTAEAAKVLENTQRDVNIALMNELALICHRLGLDTGAVLAAAGTKWNFVRFTPGLVGGHCIGVDPYYLTYRAAKAGHQADVILAGRAINNRMPAFVAAEATRLLQEIGRPQGPLVVLGASFKENVPDIRNSKIKDLLAALREAGVEFYLHDPLADSEDCRHELGAPLTPFASLPEAAGIILAVPHAEYVQGGWALMQSLLQEGRGIVLDVRSCLPLETCPAAIHFWRL